MDLLGGGLNHPMELSFSCNSRTLAQLLDCGGMMDMNKQCMGNVNYLVHLHERIYLVHLHEDYYMKVLPDYTYLVK